MKPRHRKLTLAQVWEYQLLYGQRLQTHSETDADTSLMRGTFVLQGQHI